MRSLLLGGGQSQLSPRLPGAAAWCCRTLSSVRLLLNLGLSTSSFFLTFSGCNFFAWKGEESLVL